MAHYPGHVVVDGRDFPGAAPDPEAEYAHGGSAAGEPEDDKDRAHAFTFPFMTWVAPPATGGLPVSGDFTWPGVRQGHGHARADW
jgi:hypothetical protein